MKSLTPLCFVVLFLTFGSARAQFRWPDHPKNLKVLPQDTTPAHLRATMVEFTRALGVRCSFCHVGKEGTPLSEYDFASDQKKEKQTARLMMKMEKAINETYISQVGADADEAVKVACITCHRTRNEPRMLADVLDKTLEAKGVDAAIARYKELKEKYYGGFAFDFSEPTLNQFAFRLYNQKKPDAAVAFLKLNTEIYPQSWRGFSLLGQIYAEKGEKEAAVTSLEKSLEIRPQNPRLQRLLKRLKAQK